MLTVQERTGSSNLLPPGTAHLAGHGFIGTLTALVVAGRLDLETGVRLAVGLFHHAQINHLNSN